jgi:hypothetical protein
MIAESSSRRPRYGHAEEYDSLQAEMARLEETIALLESILEINAEDDGVPPGEFSVSRLRAALVGLQLASARQERENLHARASELLVEEAPELRRPSSAGSPSSARTSRALLIGATITFVAALAIGSLYYLSASTTAQSVASSPRPGATAPPPPTLTAISLTAADVSASAPPSPDDARIEADDPAADGDSLYIADWSRGLRGWPATAGWSASDKLLLNDGSDFGDANWIGDLWNSHWVAVPYAPETELTDYAVEAEIRILDRPECGSFGLVIRDGYQAGAHLCSEYGIPIVAIRSSTPDLLVVAPFDPRPGWHTYRVEAHGSLLRMLVDGVVVAEVSDDAFPAAGWVGLWDDHTPLAVRQFRVLPL